MTDEISRIQGDLFHLMEEEIRKNCLDKAIKLAISMLANEVFKSESTAEQ